MSAARAAGLYIHVPFCTRVCPYCDFAVRTGTAARRAGYVERLVRELEAWRGAWTHPIDTVYFGGGTPSALAPEQLERILAAVSASLPRASATVVHVEANPEDATDEAIAAWSALGVGFLSLGIQSLDPARLAQLGRMHSPERARAAVRTARAAGIGTVSGDMMYALPGQSRDELARAVDDFAALELDHVSAYGLTIASGTPYERRRDAGALVELDEDDQADALELVHARLGASGYAAYELSNFHRPRAGRDHRSRHNLKYWTRAPYLGVGPSAHSFDGTRRWWNASSLPAWEAAIDRGARPIAGEETPSAQEQLLETVMLALRTSEGLDLDRVLAEHGVDLEALNAALMDRAVAEGQAIRDGRRFRLTPRGLAIADGLAARFELAE